MGRFKELFQRTKDGHSKFRHQRLIDDQIRILRILPGNFDDPIHCSLWHSSLSSQPVYDALSYTWGDASTKVPITVDGLSYHTTTNLESTLRHIRHATDALDFWVDAVCINQRDIPERNSQVARMRNIYEAARHTVVWLGDYGALTKESVESAFRLILAATTTMLKRGDDTEKAISKLVKTHYDDMRVLIHLTHRPWFYRAWVVQEVSVCRNPEQVLIWSSGPHFLVGHTKIPLWAFCFSVGNMLREHVGIAEIPREYATNGKSLKNPSEIMIFRSLRHEFLSRESGFSQAQQLVILVSRAASGFAATDERDKIYAFLGLLSSQVLPSRLRPNYALKAEKVFLDYAVYMIQETGCLDILTCRSVPRPGLPSWVPDWSDGQVCEDFHVGKVSHARFMDNNTKIEVECLILDRVVRAMDSIEIPEILPGIFSLDFASTISAPKTGQTNTKMAMLARQIRMVHETLKKFEIQWHGCWAIDAGMTDEQLDSWINAVHGRQGPGRLNRHGLTVRQLYLDLISLRQGAQTDHTDQNKETDQTDQPERDMAFWGRMGQYCSAMKRVFRYGIFQTANGSYGKVGSTDTKTRPGDAVCFIKGSSKRYIIRPVGDNWRLVGSTVEEGPVPSNVIKTGEVQPWEDFWAQNREKSQRIVLG